MLADDTPEGGSLFLFFHQEDSPLRTMYTFGLGGGTAMTSVNHHHALADAEACAVSLLRSRMASELQARKWVFQDV